MKRPNTIRLTTAQAIVKYLQVQYSELDNETRRLVPAMFGIFGHGNAAGLGQALHEYGDDLPFFQPFNEQSMVHTAAGYAKASLRTSTLACAASIGPGSTNMITGAALATVNRLPVLLFPADYYATRHQGPVLQQLEHPISADVSVNDAFRPVSRYFDRISRPEQLLTALPEAMRVLTDPVETGAVTLSLPQDIQSHAYDYPVDLFEKRIWRIERPLPIPRRIQEAAEELKKAKSPVIIAGGGVHYSRAWKELQTFAEKTGVPVGETFGGKGAFPEEGVLSLGGIGFSGNPAAAGIAKEADLVICAGTRLTDFTTGSHSIFQNPHVQFIAMNVCGRDSFKLGALPVVCDLREGLKALTKAAERAGVKPNKRYLENVEKAKDKWRRKQRKEVFGSISGQAMGQGEVIGILNESFRPGDTLVAAAGTPPADLLQNWDCYGNKNCHLEFGFSCMGYEIPAALGVRMAQKKGEVFVLIGDGTYLMQPTEIVTAVQENLKITVVLCENHGFQSIRGLQMGKIGAMFGTEFRARDKHNNRLEGDYLSIDFARNAESMGARVWNARTRDEFSSALEESRKEKGTCVIVVETEKHRYVPSSGVWWDVAPAEVTQDPVTKELRKEYEEGRKKKQRFYY
jgi:3D-(3,5/4)-trihydroxycyclohexane-1,2-dione acylhydrolase (decyclizing)